MDDATQHELAVIRHDLMNLRFVMDDYHFPAKVRESVKRRIVELEAKQARIYEREFHIQVPPHE